MNAAVQFSALTIAAAKIHRGQFRSKCGRPGGLKVPYIIHPLIVLYRLQKWGVDEPTRQNYDLWQAVLYHDVLEDTPTKFKRVVRLIGIRAARLVLELTKRTDKETYLRSFRKKSVDALVGKLADFISNTEDFLWQDRAYAPHYFAQGAVLYELINLRRSDIERRFGRSTWRAIHSDFVTIRRRLSRIKDRF